jgi:hypothetical protein
MADEIPVACCLSDEELRLREATLVAQFKMANTSTAELGDGYLFLPGDKQSLAVVSDLILAERECCPLLRVQLAAEPKMGPLTVTVTGPAGTKDFLKTIFYRLKESTRRMTGACSGSYYNFKSQISATRSWPKLWCFFFCTRRNPAFL